MTVSTFICTVSGNTFFYKSHDTASLGLLNLHILHCTIKNYLFYIFAWFFYKYDTVEISSAKQKSNLVLPSADMAKFVVNYML